MRNAGGELTERGELLGLYQAILRGAQIVERFRKVVGALAQFVEKARILNGNNGLGSEIPHQRNLLVGEGPDFLSINAERSDQLVFLEQGHLQERPSTPEFRDGDHPRITVNVGLMLQDIRNLDRLLCYRNLTQRDFWVGAEWIFLKERTPRGRQVPLSDSAISIFFFLVQKQHGEFRLAKTHGVLQHGLEHGLQLAR